MWPPPPPLPLKYASMLKPFKRAYHFHFLKLQKPRRNRFPGKIVLSDLRYKYFGFTKYIMEKFVDWCTKSKKVKKKYKW